MWTDSLVDCMGWPLTSLLIVQRRKFCSDYQLQDAKSSQYTGSRHYHSQARLDHLHFHPSKVRLRQQKALRLSIWYSWASLCSLCQCRLPQVGQLQSYLCLHSLWRLPVEAASLQRHFLQPEQHGPIDSARAHQEPICRHWDSRQTRLDRWEVHFYQWCSHKARWWFTPSEDEWCLLRLLS